MRDKRYYQDAPPYCHYFFDLIPTEDLLSELDKSLQSTIALIGQIIPEKENYSYQSNKWTTKEVIRHIIDCERIYTYRALRFSRFDDTELRGFDEDMYIANLKALEENLRDLEEEFLYLRKSTIALFKSMTEEMLDFRGIANEVIYSPRTLGYMTVGHNLHHCNFIRTHYLDGKG